MPEEHVHENEGVARQVAAGQVAVVWSKIQQTQECALGQGMSYRATKVNVF